MASKTSGNKKKSSPKKPAKKTPVKSTNKTPKKPAVKSRTSSVKKKKSGNVKKGIVITLIIIIVLIAAVITYFLTNLNMIVKMAIEKYGSEAIGTAVRVKRVNIQLKEGSAFIEGLTVANPEGFETPLAFSLGKTGADIDLASLKTDEIGIEDIVVKAPEIFVEINKDNKNNLNELMKNLPKAPAKTKSSEESKETKEVKMHIHHLIFEKGRIYAKVVPMNKDYELDMPKVEMQNLRGTPQEITKQIIQKLGRVAVKEVQRKGVGQATDQLKKEATKKVTDNLKKKLKF